MRKCIIIYLLSLLAVACGKDKFDGIELSTGDEIKLSSEKQTVRVGIRSGSDWEVANPPSWCSASKVTSEYGDSLVLNTKVNTNTEERSGSVTLVNSDQQLTFKITQSGEHYFELPVVFHVLYTNESDINEYIPGDSIRKYMNYVNEFYRNTSGKSINLNLEFVLASNDPDGRMMMEPGIHRVQQSSITYDIDDYLLRNKYNGTDLIWDPNKYINIIVCTFTEKNVTGVSMLPYTPQHYALPGLNRNDAYYTSLPTKFVQALMINNNTIYKKEIGPDGYQWVGPVTLAHELGHYLGLFHVFSGGENGQSTDYCDDTPDYDRPTYEAWFNLQWELTHNPILVSQRVSRNDEAFTSKNIMDYYVGYRDRITADQRARMRHVLDYSPLIPGPKIAISSRSTSRAVPIAEGPQIIR